jgi:hypothetical protein
MLHEWVELVKALLWPGVVIYLSVRFGSEIRKLLGEVPYLFRRVQSAKAMGVEFQLVAQLEQELPAAEDTVQQMQLKKPLVPSWPQIEKGD